MSHISNSTPYADPKSLESIPPALLKTIPAGQPPPGIEPNFADPPTRVPVILGLSVAFLILAIFCFSIRIYTKLVIAKKWNWADLTCSLGFICSIVYFVAMIMGCVDGATGRHMWDVHLDKLISKINLQQGYIRLVVVTPALGLIKCGLFIQYYLLFRLLRWVRISVWIGATISVSFYVAVTLIAFVLNSPWPGESLVEAFLSWHYHKFAQFFVPTGVIGMLVDLYLFILPIPAVLDMQMSAAKKLGVLIVFMTGGVAAVASIVSLYYRIQLQTHYDDAYWDDGYVALWAQIEMFAGVAASSMPTVKLFFGRQNFSLSSCGSFLKAGLTRLLGRSVTIPLDNREGHKMEDLESDGCERKAAKTSPVEDTQIHLTQDSSFTEEELDDAAFGLLVTGRYHEICDRDAKLGKVTLPSAAFIRPPGQE